MLQVKIEAKITSELRAQMKKANSMFNRAKMDEVEKIYEKTNIEYEDDDDNPDELLNRIEFMEFLMRFAQQMAVNNKKWNQELKITDGGPTTVSSALTHLLNEKLRPFIN